jgi:hypothetical protein
MEARSVESDTRHCSKTGPLCQLRMFVGWSVRCFYMTVKSPVCTNLYEIWEVSSDAWFELRLHLLI